MASGALPQLRSRVAPLPPDLVLPPVVHTRDSAIDAAVSEQLLLTGQPAHAYGRLGDLSRQMARIRVGTAWSAEPPQLLVFAADHGLADESLSDEPQTTTGQRVVDLLAGRTPVNRLARQHDVALTVVDAGLGHALPPLPPPDAMQATLQLRKIAYGTRNARLGPAMSVPQAVAALHAGMDLVRQLPGDVLMLGDTAVANEGSAALLLSRLCGVPLSDAFAPGMLQMMETEPALWQKRLDVLLAVGTRHRHAVGPVAALAALGGYEIAMMAGAMLQAASQRRLVLLDSVAAGAAALIARGLVPAVGDYLVFAQRSAETGHRLMLIHLQAQPLLDLDMRVEQGLGCLLAWPTVLAARRLLESGVQ